MQFHCFTQAQFHCYLFTVELKYTFQLLKPKILFCEEAMADNAAAAAESLTTPPFIVVVDKSKVGLDSRTKCYRCALPTT